MEAQKNISRFDAEIVCDAFSYEKKPEIKAFIESPEIDKIIQIVGRRFILVLGGDGTMLRAVQNNYNRGLPFLGINFGTKGFLLNEKNATLEATSFFEQSYPLLEAEVTVEGQVLQHVAMNEIQIKTASGGMADLTFDIGNLSRIRAKGDGLLIVTPAGSTGYNQSAGGPILPHSSHHFIATPLLPFEPKGLRPIPYESKEEVRIVNNNERKRKLSVYADSIPIIEGIDSDIEVIVREYEKKVELLIADTYARIWHAKPFVEQGMEAL